MSNVFETDREQALSKELARTRHVWGHIVHGLCHGLYPARDSRVYKGGTNFKGSDWEGLFEIFKILDFEVRHIQGVMRKLDIEPNYILIDPCKVFDEISKATGLTEESHKKSDQS